MKSVEAIAEEIIAREGGYLNDPDDPDDPGGATNYGVTIGTMRRLRLDLTGDGKVSTADVRALTREKAKEVFIRDYFERPRIGEFPEPLQACVFDMYVNAGANAVEILRRLLRDMGQAISVDGAIGPRTIEAAGIAYASAPNHLADAYGIARAEEFISVRYHLTEAEHARRVAAWG